MSIMQVKKAAGRFNEHHVCRQTSRRQVRLVRGRSDQYQVGQIGKTSGRQVRLRQVGKTSGREVRLGAGNRNSWVSFSSPGPDINTISTTLKKWLSSNHSFQSWSQPLAVFESSHFKSIGRKPYEFVAFFEIFTENPVRSYFSNHSLLARDQPSIASTARGRFRELVNVLMSRPRKKN